MTLQGLVSGVQGRNLPATILIVEAVMREFLKSLLTAFFIMYLGVVSLWETTDPLGDYIVQTLLLNLGKEHRSRDASSGPQCQPRDLYSGALSALNQSFWHVTNGLGPHRSDGTPVQWSD